LLKVTLYAESSGAITKGLYLRRREDLILRVEARTPNDDEGTYELSFAGSFEPIVGGPDIAETDTSPVAAPPKTSAGRRTKRVSSVGARIDEPEPPVTEVAAAPVPTPEATPEEAIPEKTTAAPEEPAKESAKAPPPRSSRSRRPTRTPTTRRAEPKKPASVAEEEKKIEEPAEAAEPTVKPKTSSRRAKRGTGTTTPATKPEPSSEPTAEAESGPRLIIETNDGTLIDRSMSGVKRVMVENGQVVVVGKDGKVNRFLLANVVRMSIAP
jgi:hypothetical protein